MKKSLYIGILSHWIDIKNIVPLIDKRLVDVKITLTFRNESNLKLTSQLKKEM